ncbi:MAG: GntR family transcriptional regulator [Planctomycetes bacterium]|nr:GntR family transcriptional regulator [Planctomycetota bacterium]
MPTIATSRGTAELVDAIRGSIRSGHYTAGRYLPSVRQLAGEHGVSPETVRRGLLALAREGLLQPRPRQGFMVRTSEDGATTLGPVAYVTQYTRDLSDAQPVNWALDRTLQIAAGRRGWTTLGTHAAGVAPERFREQLATARTWAVVLDTLSPELADLVRASNLPVVMVNSWLEGSDFDTVLQDNYLGGFLAAKYLVASGAKRIAWVNPVAQYCHSRERFAGAVAGLAACGLSFDPELIVDAGGDEASDETERRLRALFKGKQRPDAALVFWKGIAQRTVAVARDCGLRVGRELKVVGWCVEELYESEHCSIYAGGPTPPAIVWRASTMADAALDLLEARRKGEGRTGAQAGAMPVRVLVPTRVRLADRK